MQANAIFRAAGPSDAPDLACLIDSASRGFALWMWTALRSPGQTVLEVARNRILNVSASPLHYAGFTVVEVDGVVAGALTGRFIPVPYHRGDAADLPDLLEPLLELEAIAAGTWFLNILAVYPEFRGKGLGSTLIGQAEGLARQAGASTMSIIVEDANHDAHRLYLRYGFEEWQRRPYLPFPGSDDQGDWVLLRKEIGQ